MRLALLIALMADSLWAQAPPDGQSVRELLASNDPARLAWGAELAARSGREEFVPDLLPLLHWTDERVQEQALDALIRLKAKVPAAAFTPLPQFTDQVIILAAANGHRDILLSLLNENPLNDATWVALNESLLRIGGGRIYWPALLRDWTIHVVIYVTDPGRVAVLPPQQGGGQCGSSIAQDRPGFPPRAAYGLFLDPKPGDTVLSSNPRPVYYRRQSGPSGCDVRIDRDDYRADSLAWVAHETTPLKGHLRFDIAWPTDDAYAAEVDRLRKQTIAGFQEILDSMVKRRMLPPEDAVLRPHIVLGIEDQRSNKPHDLPATPPWE
jgi:hypothetical protein